ncbi:hypothetical protein [Actinomadura rubrisoli]|uniref:GerMN domain-containing protein n=1 Tax=Actinomadura rubrisoli TaxID=2530368 RepID=A0A4R5CBA4_9ACTN|nr:hypothetical protein [Actinomadura rubrisoli]TDD97231.1 hypothetical protein E1298_01995 [Actinomadura rubrisoli]
MRRPAGPARAMMAAVLAVAVAAGCGVRPTGIISAGDKPVANGQAATITVYLLRGGRLTPVVRPGLPGHPYLGVTQLGVAITSAERRQGLSTEVPWNDGLVVRREGRPGDLVVDVSQAQWVNGKLIYDVKWSRAAMGQVACTAQAVPGVKRVVLAGVLHREENNWITLTCEEFDDLLG